jgi:uncharacterized protein with ATP-grasp and redox domains
VHTWPDCAPCILRMNLETIRSIVDDDDRAVELMDAVVRVFGESWADEGAYKPPEIVAFIWRELVRITGDADPMRAVKDQQNSLALSLLPAARELVAAAPDPFLAAVKLAAAGNVLDVMVSLDETPGPALLERLADRWVDESQVDVFRERLAQAHSVLYFLDNCGEIVFDRLLLEVVRGILPGGGPQITVVARQLPALNDATVADALAVGLGEVASVVGNGIPESLPGTDLGMLSEEVRALLDDADLVVSKGGANFEMLEGEAELHGRVTFLLLGKCIPLCSTLAVPRNGLAVHNI